MISLPKVTEPVEQRDRLRKLEIILPCLAGVTSLLTFHSLSIPWHLGERRGNEGRAN